MSAATVANLDDRVTAWINSMAGTWSALDWAMVNLSRWGIPLLVLAAALRWWGRDRDTMRHAIAAAGMSFVLALAINQVVLLFVHRLRPYEYGVTHLIVARSHDPSFPSDHATAGFAIAAAFLLRRIHGMGAACLIAAAAIALSRVFVGTHYVGDVIGGAVTGLLAASIVLLVYRRDPAFDRRVTSIL